MADTGAPRYPIIHVVHPDGDVSSGEPGIVWVHDELTGETSIQDAEPYFYGPRKQ
jgi:hypothetical protein